MNKVYPHELIQNNLQNTLNGKRVAEISVQYDKCSKCIVYTYLCERKYKKVLTVVTFRQETGGLRRTFTIIVLKK